MLFFTLPMSIIGFVLTVTFTVLGLVLSPVGIGLPLLHASIRAAHGMMKFDLDLQRELLSPAATEGWPEPAELGPFRFRDMFTQARLYAPVLYWTMKLPLACFQFAFTVMFPLCGAGIILFPVIYTVLSSYGIEIEKYSGDYVMNVLLPTLTADQRSWVAFGVGLAMVVIGGGVLNGLAKASVRLLNGLGAAAPGQAIMASVGETGRVNVIEAPAAATGYPSLDSYVYGKEEAFSG